MNKGQQPRKTQAADTQSALELAPPTIEPMELTVPADAENMKAEGTDLDSPLERSGPL